MADEVIIARRGAAAASTTAPVTRSFCGVCGSPIAYADGRIGDRIYFMLGAMDAPENYKPTLHAYVREQLPFVHMPDGLPRHLGTSVPRPDDGTTHMKLTLSWLKDHLETDASLAEIVERLTSIGLEVESVDDKAGLKPFVIAKVLTARKASRRRQAARADRRYRRRQAAGAGGLRRAQCARRAWSAPSPRPAPTFPAST